MKRTEKQNKTRNGVRVIVTRHYDSNGQTGSTVDASCTCFGYPFRTHNNSWCPNLKEEYNV